MVAAQVAIKTRPAGCEDAPPPNWSNSSQNQYADPNTSHWGGERLVRIRGAHKAPADQHSASGGFPTHVHTERVLQDHGNVGANRFDDVRCVGPTQSWPSAHGSGCGEHGCDSSKRAGHACLSNVCLLVLRHLMFLCSGHLRVELQMKFGHAQIWVARSVDRFHSIPPGRIRLAIGVGFSNATVFGDCWAGGGGRSPSSSTGCALTMLSHHLRVRPARPL